MVIALLSWLSSFAFLWSSCVLPQIMVHLPDSTFSSTLFTVLLPELLSKVWGFSVFTMIEQSHFTVKESQCTLILLILSYPATGLNDIIKIGASLLLFKILPVCSFQSHLLLQCPNSSVAV